VHATKRLFSASDLACMRGGRLLFQNLSFALGSGDVAHLAGPNGSGKTSLLRILCGALPPAMGKVVWHGKNFLEDGMAAHAARYAFLPADDRSLKAVETAGESLAFWAEFQGGGDVAAALKKMDIAKLADTPVRRLSAGQKRRLSLARVFLRDVPLWLLDEPLNGLDMKSYDLFMDALHAHSKKGGMAVLASHYTVEPPHGRALTRIEIGYGP
jgi:heme exporter protein A